ncbi:patronin isoform X10 [Microplitis mediator]|uniref:patronin isoform X10 n=1 Tax=Microplitis mediator TaxID=375433 RepID=UPI0025543FF2|nr:patronin isoform X10 [Microplitis mediator]
MWGTISRLFATKPRPSVRTPEPGEEAVAAEEEEGNYYYNNSDPACKNLNDVPQAELAVHVFESMDRNMGDDRRPKGGPGDQHGVTDNEHFSDAYDKRQAKQRASVKWLLSKAYNNRVPDNLREPYYRDHEEQEHLKPQIVHALSNAELYCLALANIYSDPNYHNQNHWGILQALARKGVYVAEPNNSQLTETILIQNSPLKMSAHMAVIEGLMVLYAKEVVTGDRVVAAIRRFDPEPEVQVPSDHEKGLLMWISHASHALIAKIQTEEGAGDKTRLPELPPAKDFQSLCDGVGLAAVVAFYCPGELNWMDIKVSKRPSVADALHNLSLVHNFCIRCLPYSIFHMQPEDVTYMRGSMKQNLLVFLADMYNVLEIHPVKCVRYPGEERAMQYLDACPRNSHGVAHKRSLPQAIAPIPDLRSNLSVSAPGFTVAKPIPSSSVRKSQSLQQTAESHSYDERRGGSEENFIVHKNRGIPTLSSVIDDRYNNTAAGRPSNWEDQRRSSYAGRRSRRNSVTDDSQLTIENFGGSQDNLHNFGCVRNPDKELVHTGKRTATEPTLPARSSVQDVYGSDVQHILSDNGYANDEPPTRLRRQISNSSLNNTSHKNILHSTDNNDNTDSEIKSSSANTSTTSATKMSSFANLTQHNSEKSINFKYTEQQDHDHELSGNKINYNNKKFGQSNGNGIGEKKTTFATLPNTTTWQQQSAQQSQQLEQQSTDENGGNTIMYASQINNIRMKLEEKRRHIENEKRKMEVVVSKQRQKVGKAAFLQAVTKFCIAGKVKSPSSSTSGGDSPVEHGPPTPLSSGSAGDTPTSVTETTSSVSQQNAQEKPQRPFSLKEITEDIHDVEHKWLEQDGSAPFTETRRTPDIENMDFDQCQQSISHMNSSLSEIQADIQRLASQQNQIQQQHLMTQQQHQIHQQLQQLQSLSQQHLQSYVMPPINPMTPRLQDPQPGQFYLHDQPQQMQRRTWGRPAQQQNLVNEMASVGHYQQQPVVDTHYSPQPVAAASVIYQQDPRLYQDTRTWGSGALPQQKGFVLHDNTQDHQQYQPRYINGDHSLCNTQMHQQISNYPSAALFNQTQPTAASPQHRNAVHRISQLINESPETKKSTVHHVPITCESPTDKRQNNINIHAPVPAPPADDMEPQNISFIGNDEDFAQGIKRLHITSGSRTYRIASPTKTTISRNSFQPHSSSLREASPSPTSAISPPEITPLDSSDAGEKGFYISFDNDGPKKPKPALRVKRSPKKERTVSSFIEQEDFTARPESPPANAVDRQRQQEAQRDLDRERQRQAEEREYHRQDMRDRELRREIDKEQRSREDRLRTNSDSRQNPAGAVGLVIGNQLANPDPNSIDEMERKKERIMLLSLQRRQQQEELKERKEAEAQARREQEKMKEEERARKKEDDRQRRAMILEQHKLKKAIEEAEREGKVIDKELLNAIKPTPKLRNKTASARPRPKTIHVDQSSELDSGALTPSRGKKGSSSNLSTDTDSGLGRATPPRRAPSPGMGSTKHLPSPSGPGSLPPGLMSKRRFDDGSSDISSTPSSMMEYNGPRLYKQPATKSNRGIMLNAVEYCVFPGTVNKEAKRRVLEEIGRSESKHFLILFRDAGCQFRALYSYCPDREEVTKLCGTGPKQVIDNMFDKFFKYNSGGKCFSQVHTKHLTVTIDAFTIHNSLWQGKKVNLPNKKDMALVI